MFFYSGGSDFTPAHNYKDFQFTTYSPVAFRFFREAFQIKAEDYLVSKYYFIKWLLAIFIFSLLFVINL